MIDLVKEGPPVPLADVPALRCVPRRRGKVIHIASVYRWTTDGIQGVVLETVQCAGMRCTTVAALMRFFERLSTANEPATKQPRTRREERRAVGEAERVLDARGIGSVDRGRGRARGNRAAASV